MLFAVEMPLLSVVTVPIVLALMLAYMWLDARMIRRIKKQLAYERNSKLLIADQYSNALSKVQRQRNEESMSQISQAIKERDEAKARLDQAINERNEAKANFDQAIRDLHQQKEASRKQCEGYEAAATERIKKITFDRDQAVRQKLDAMREKEEVEELLRRTTEGMASCIEENKALVNERNQVRANFLALLCDHGEAGRTIGELAHYVREMKKLACLAEERLPQQDRETPATLPDDPITAESPPSAADDFFEQYVAAANEVTECPWDHNPNITIVRRKEDGAIVGIRGIPTSVEYESLTKMIDDEEKARQRIEPGQESNPC